MAKKSVKIKEEFAVKFDRIKKYFEFEFDYEVVEYLINNKYLGLYGDSSGDIRVKLMRDINCNGFKITQDIKISLGVAERLYKKYRFNPSSIVNTNIIEGINTLDLYITLEELGIVKEKLQLKDTTDLDNISFILPNDLCALLVSKVEFVEDNGVIKQHISKHNILRCILGEQSSICN